VEIEITEDDAMLNVDQTVRVLHTLKDLGFHFAIDNFGTGYSSLAMLQTLPIETLKIDRSLTREVARSDTDAAITKAMISVARTLDLKVVAEGVETHEQLQTLVSQGLITPRDCSSAPPCRPMMRPACSPTDSSSCRRDNRHATVGPGRPEG
jgi:EAL domain-containing protein (putative c-di-GMP-specific phosphodiesterase class I)